MIDIDPGYHRNLGIRSGQTRLRLSYVQKRLVRALRHRDGIPADVHYVDVLERLADELEGQVSGPP